MLSIQAPTLGVIVRRFDADVDLYYQYKEIRKTYQILGAQFRAAEKAEKEAKRKLINAMRTSKIASFKNQPLFEITEGGRDSATVDRVRKYAPPEVQDLIIEHLSWPIIKFLDEEEKN
jgi:hypothetical protein